MITLAMWEIQRRHSDCWFEPKSNSFFKTRLCQDGYAKREGSDAFFVSSEKLSGHRRAYSVRRLNWETGAISTVGAGFQGYDNIRAAKKAAQGLAASDA